MNTVWVVLKFNLILKHQSSVNKCLQHNITTNHFHIIQVVKKLLFKVKFLQTAV